jgi:hypothetical protein
MTKAEKGILTNTILYLIAFINSTFKRACDIGDIIDDWYMYFPKVYSEGILKRHLHFMVTEKLIHIDKNGLVERIVQ